MTSSRPLLLVPQPSGTNLCGQTCVAILLDVSVDTACELVGRKGLTGTRHIRAGLEARGWTLGDRINAKKHLPENGKVYMARVHWQKGGKRTHWVVVNAHGVIIDPVYGFDPEWARLGVSYLTSLYEVGPPALKDG